MDVQWMWKLAWNSHSTFHQYIQSLRNLSKYGSLALHFMWENFPSDRREDRRPFNADKKSMCQALSISGSILWFALLKTMSQARPQAQYMVSGKERCAVILLNFILTKHSWHLTAKYFSHQNFCSYSISTATQILQGFPISTRPALTSWYYNLPLPSFDALFLL